MQWWSEMSLRWKVLVIALLAPVLIAVVFAYQRVTEIREGAVQALLSKSKAIVMMAEATRDNMARKVEMGVMKSFAELRNDPKRLLEAVPVVTAIKTAAENAEKAGYKFRVPKISPRNPANEPTALELEVLREIKSRGLSEKVVFEKDKIRYFRPIRLSKECLFCHGSPKGGQDPLGGTMEGWHEGEVHGAFEIITSLAPAQAQVRQAAWSIAAYTLFILLIMGAMIWFLVRRSILEPVFQTNAVLTEVTKGDLTQTVEVSTRDELGDLASMFNLTIQSLKDVLGKVVETNRVLEGSAQEMSAISESLTAEARDTVDRSNTVASASEEMSVNMNSVAAAMEEATTNISTVAQATEGISRTIDGILKNVEQTKDNTLQAVEQVNEAAEEVNNLGAAALEIAKFTDTINTISSQTNLLALNATIEAARAGEAGKGFAVVANEIKELAQQTAEATDEISKKVDGIQGSTKTTVEVINRVVKAIEGINDLVLKIAEAVEEQAGSIREIAENVNQASLGIQEVNENVAQSSLAAEDVAKEIAKVNQGASGLSKSGDQLSERSLQLAKIVETFTDLLAYFKM